MISRLVSDEVADGIAAIELHRQGTEQESGLAAACSEAVRKLQALLEHEKEALQLHGAGTVHAINVEAVANEIRRVQAMVGGKGQGGASKNNARGRGQQQQRPRPEGARNAARKRGRRNLGRGGRSGRGGRGGRGGGGADSGSSGGGAGPDIR